MKQQSSAEGHGDQYGDHTRIVAVVWVCVCVCVCVSFAGSCWFLCFGSWLFGFFLWAFLNGFVFLGVLGLFKYIQVVIR